MTVKIFVIAIIMWWANPDDIPYPYDDSVEIKTYQGKPLFFDSLDKCLAWAKNDLESLKTFGHAYYPSATAVKEIGCIEKTVQFRYEQET